jgi:hypothetical protein
MSKLGQVMQRPAALHFIALREIAKYLVQTINDGPIYWRRERAGRPDLNDVPFPTRIPPIGDDSTPWLYDGLSALHFGTADFGSDDRPLDEHYQYLLDLAESLSSMTDSDFASNLRHRRSTMGHIHMLFGGLIDFIARVAHTIARSTGEAELAAAGDGEKRARYHRHILTGLGMTPRSATPFFIDSRAAELVAKASGTTKRLRHVDVQHFALQESTQRKIIAPTRVTSYYNLSDLTSKITTKAIQGRLILRIYGYYGPQILIETASRITKARNESRDGATARNGPSDGTTDSFQSTAHSLSCDSQSVSLVPVDLPDGNIFILLAGEGVDIHRTDQSRVVDS